MFEISKNHSCVITYPEDVSVGKNFNDKSEIKQIDKILDDDLILDIGPKTINKIKNIIEISKTILWNGPAGYFENSNFASGSYEIAKAIVKKNMNKSIYSVVGGGDTIAVINQIKAIKNFNVAISSCALSFKVDTCWPRPPHRFYHAPRTVTTISLRFTLQYLESSSAPTQCHVKTTWIRLSAKVVHGSA